MDKCIEDEKLYPKEATAKFLGLKNPHTLDVWRNTKRYPELSYIKIGRLVRYKGQAIKRFIELRTVNAEANGGCA